MNTRLITFNILALSALAVLFLRAQQGAGSLDPTTDPEDGVYRTLEEVYAAAKAIEPRTAIVSAPYVIDQPGSYILVDNIEASPAAGAAAIRIEASNVTLDLNGFTLSSTPDAGGHAIEVVAAGDVTVRNGFITGNSSFDDSTDPWTHTPGGFDIGVLNATHVTDLGVRGCRSTGISSTGKRSIVKNCIVGECQDGIFCDFGTVSACGATGNGSGIDASSGIAIDCHSHDNEHVGIVAAVVNRCVASSNGGAGLDADVVVASSASENEDGAMGKVISQTHAADNAGTGLKGIAPSAVSLSSASDNTTADIDSPGTQTGNFPTP